MPQQTRSIIRIVTKLLDWVVVRLVERVPLEPTIDPPAAVAGPTLILRAVVPRRRSSFVARAHTISDQGAMPVREDRVAAPMRCWDSAATVIAPPPALVSTLVRRHPSRATTIGRSWRVSPKPRRLPGVMHPIVRSRQ